MTDVFRIALVTMPFASANVPSLQIGLLSAVCMKRGFDTQTHHLNLDLAAVIPDIYESIVEFDGSLRGEMLFAEAAFGEQPGCLSRETELAMVFSDMDPKRVCELREKVLPSFLTRCYLGTDWGQYAVVGFSSSFQQNTASLALAKMIKARWPMTVTLLGGANLAGPMGEEVLRAFPYIDAVCTGEGDEALPEFLSTIRVGRLGAYVPGIITRVHSSGSTTARPLFDRLDELPTPDYSEYFERRRILGLGPTRKPIPFEASRGCWWGQKHHCSFCGLNARGMAFRRKNAERVIEELIEIASRYQVSDFMATDNILSHGHIEELFGRIRNEKLDFRFFLEVKANLRPDQIRALRAGGVRWVQPGIESLSSRVLSLMRKGSTLLQNVRFLRWCSYYRVRAAWNILWGMPGEEGSDYEEMLCTMRLITHLEPPRGFYRIRVDRFSPLYEDMKRGQFGGLNPLSAYSRVYPEVVRLAEIAYYFESAATPYTSYHAAVGDCVREWNDAWSADGGIRPVLSYRKLGGDLLFYDTRRTREPEIYNLTGVDARIYEACVLSERGRSQIAKALEDVGLEEHERISEMDERLVKMCERGLMIRENGCYLSLAIPANANW